MLKEALEDYNKLQEKCMQHLSYASIIYPRDSSVDLLKTKFITLHDKAIAFVSKKLVQPDIANYMISSSFKKMYLSGGSQYHENIIWNWVNSELNDSK